MWYFLAKWLFYNTEMYTQFESLRDLEQWWVAQKLANPNETWRLEIYDRTGCRIFTDHTPVTDATIDLLRKLNKPYLDLREFLT